MTFAENREFKDEYNNEQDCNNYVLDDLQYIMEFTKLVSVFLKQGCDITQLPNGDSIISQTKVVHTHYKWSSQKNKFSKILQHKNKIDSKSRYHKFRCSLF